MFYAMLIIISSLFGAAIMFTLCYYAPYGREDENGFHEEDK